MQGAGEYASSNRGARLSTAARPATDSTLNEEGAGSSRCARRSLRLVERVGTWAKVRFDWAVVVAGIAMRLWVYRWRWRRQRSQVFGPDDLFVGTLLVLATMHAQPGKSHTGDAGCPRLGGR